MSAVTAHMAWIPLFTGDVRPTQGKPQALTLVCGGSQGFNAGNRMRPHGRSVRMIILPNLSQL